MTSQVFSNNTVKMPTQNIPAKAPLKGILKNSRATPPPVLNLRKEKEQYTVELPMIPLVLVCEDVPGIGILTVARRPISDLPADIQRALPSTVSLRHQFSNDVSSIFNLLAPAFQIPFIPGKNMNTVLTSCSGLETMTPIATRIRIRIMIQTAARSLIPNHREKTQPDSPHLQQNRILPSLARKPSKLNKNNQKEASNGTPQFPSTKSPAAKKEMPNSTNSTI